MIRQVVLDTETTGLRTEDGHRLIEIGCLEMIDRKLTGKHYHQYINPEREIDAGALAVHGISNDFLKDKPVFSAVVNELIQFIDGAELIIHNAPFDVGFINHELALLRHHEKVLGDYCSITDTLAIARRLHTGQRNSLDALCKRYAIDNSKREFHGALLDAHLLAQVYLAMTGGQGSFFDTLAMPAAMQHSEAKNAETKPVSHAQLVVIKADTDEIKAHEEYLAALKKRGKCVWLDD